MAQTRGTFPQLSNSVKKTIVGKKPPRKPKPPKRPKPKTTRYS